MSGTFDITIKDGNRTFKCRLRSVDMTINHHELYIDMDNKVIANYGAVNAADRIVELHRHYDDNISDDDDLKLEVVDDLVDPPHIVSEGSVSDPKYKPIPEPVSSPEPEPYNPNHEPEYVPNQDPKPTDPVPVSNQDPKPNFTPLPALVYSPSPNAPANERKHHISSLDSFDASDLNTMKQLCRSGDPNRPHANIRFFADPKFDRRNLCHNDPETFNYFCSLYLVIDDWIIKSMNSPDPFRKSFASELDYVFHRYLLKFPKLLTDSEFSTLIRLIETNPEPSEYSAICTKLSVSLSAIRDNIINDIICAFDCQVRCSCVICNI